jgi:hypothetical protein
MSQLIDKLNRVAQATSQPMGFGAARTAKSESRIILIASLTFGDTSRLADGADSADAVLLRLAKSRLATDDIKKIAGALPDMPWGGYLEDADTKKVATMIKAGCDFLVFTAATPVTATPQEEKVGKVLQVESTLDDGSTRAINDLAVDAVLITDAYPADGSIAWHNLIKVQRLANLLTKPLIVPIPLNVSDSELKAIWEAGVDGVIVAADTGKPEELEELRRAISKLPPRSARKRGKAEALLPRVSGDEAKATPEEDEEEEEE